MNRFTDRARPTKTNLLFADFTKARRAVTVIDPTGELAGGGGEPSCPPALTQRALYFDPARHGASGRPQCAGKTCRPDDRHRVTEQLCAYLRGHVAERLGRTIKLYSRKTACGLLLGRQRNIARRPQTPYRPRFSANSSFSGAKIPWLERNWEVINGLGPKTNGQAALAPLQNKAGHAAHVSDDTQHRRSKRNTYVFQIRRMLLSRT